MVGYARLTRHANVPEKCPHRNMNLWSWTALNTSPVLLANWSKDVKKLEYPYILFKDGSLYRLVIGSSHSSASADLLELVHRDAADMCGDLVVENSSGNVRSISTGSILFDKVRVLQVCTGMRFVLSRDVNGCVWSWGTDNTHGQLGNGSVHVSDSPCKLDGLESITHISCGWSHGIAIDDTCLVYTWGNGAAGRLGSGVVECDDAFSPTMIEKRLLSVSCGYGHNLGVDEYGGVWVWGLNSHGQCAVRSIPFLAGPHKVQLSVAVLGVSAGAMESYVTTAQGSVFGWGGGVCIPKKMSGLLGEAVHVSGYDRGGIATTMKDVHRAVDDSEESRESIEAVEHFVNPETEYRPKGLPPKNQEELKKHEKEVKKRFEKLRVFEKRVHDESKKADAKQHAKLLEREAIISKETAFWVRTLNNLTHNEFFNLQTRPSVVARVFLNGIPPLLRGSIWKLALGNPLRVSPALFEMCKQRVLDSKCVDRSIDEGQSVTSLIEVDVQRTFPELAFFEEGLMRESLVMILECFCFWKPEITYVQGMSYVAGNLLLYLEEADAFTCLCNIMGDGVVRDFVQLDGARISQWMSPLFELINWHTKLAARCPGLFFERQVVIDMFFMEWFITLFCKTLSLDVAGRVWDSFCIEGPLFLFKTAAGISIHSLQASNVYIIAILKVLEPQLTGLCLEDAIKVLISTPKTMDATSLFKSMPSRIPSGIIESLAKCIQTPE